MCGIVGLFLKDKSLEPQLGEMLSNMLITMSDRGPDSAGIAMYSGVDLGHSKVTIQSSEPEAIAMAHESISALIGKPVAMFERDTHAVLEVSVDDVAIVRAEVAANHPSVRVMSSGESVEIYKEVGLPSSVVERFGIREMSGSHGVGHTRMATESAVTTMGAHPFSTDEDQCLVHNGSLSNHNSLRRKLIKNGMTFETENDTEVGAAYIANQMKSGSSLGDALEASLNDLDGFFTFVIGTKDGFGVLRDPIACKPAVLAETDQYVAFGSEYRALVDLPGIEEANVWEPEPATVYFWER